MTKTKKKFIWSVVIKSLLLILGIVGLITTLMGASFMGKLQSFLYFTIQSNITIMIMIAIFLISDILQYTKGKGFTNTNGWRIAKFVFTVAITVTFLVFFLVLAPTGISLKYLFSLNNLCVHAFVPILAIIDFIIFDYEIKLERIKPIWGIAMPLYYAFFSLICSFAGVAFGVDADGADIIVPYFFLNYKKYGWFSIDDGLGVAYWIVIMTIFMSGLSFLLAYFIKLRKNSIDKRQE